MTLISHVLMVDVEEGNVKVSVAVPAEVAAMSMYTVQYERLFNIYTQNLDGDINARMCRLALALYLLRTYSRTAAL